MNSQSLTAVSSRTKQRGAALLTALAFLVVLTLLGIGVYSTTTSEEKMARNFRDKEIALQSAEAALNEAKMLINGSYNSGGTQRKPLSEESCYKSTPTGFTCDPTTPVATLDLFSGSITGAPVGQIGTDISPTIVGLYEQHPTPLSGDLATRLGLRHQQYELLLPDHCPGQRVAWPTPG